MKVLSVFLLAFCSNWLWTLVAFRGGSDGLAHVEAKRAEWRYKTMVESRLGAEPARSVGVSVPGQASSSDVLGSFIKRGSLQPFGGQASSTVVDSVILLPADAPKLPNSPSGCLTLRLGVPGNVLLVPLNTGGEK